MCPVRMVESVNYSRKGVNDGFTKRFIQDESSLETIEWSVVATLIVAGMVLEIANLATTWESRFERLRLGTTTP